MLALLVCPAAAEERAASELPALIAEVSRLEEAGQYDEAVKAARRVVASLEKSAGPDRLPLGKALLSLARLQVLSGKAQDAVPLLKRAANTLDEIDDRQQPEVADALNDLGMIYQMKGRPAEAIPIYRRALLIRNRETGRLNERLKSIAASQSQPEGEDAGNAAEQPATTDPSAGTIQAEDPAGEQAAQPQEAEADERAAMTNDAAAPSAAPAEPQSAATEPEQPAETPAEVVQQPSSPESQTEEPAVEAANEPQSPAANEEVNAAADGPAAEAEAEAQAEAAAEPAPTASGEDGTEPSAPEQQALVQPSEPDAQIAPTQPPAKPEIVQPSEATPPAAPESPSHSPAAPADEDELPAPEQTADQQLANPDAAAEAESASDEPGSFAHEVPQPERRPRPQGSAFAWIEPERGGSGTAPAAADILAGLEIVYYRKPGDGEKISEALSNRKITHEVVRSQAQQYSTSNAIACGPDTPVEALKQLAHAFIDSGVPLRAITRFRNPAGKKQRFEIYTVAGVSTADGGGATSPLSREQVDAITACPQLMQN